MCFGGLLFDLRSYLWLCAFLRRVISVSEALCRKVGGVVSNHNLCNDLMIRVTFYGSLIMFCCSITGLPLLRRNDLQKIYLDCNIFFY